VKDATIPALAAIAVLAMLFVPPIHQDPAYHHFADQRTLFGIPNFFNVVSNLPFLFVAIWGWRAARTLAHRVFLIGVAMVTFGSAYYHAWPDNATLFWDRLPMTVAFMALLAMFLGQRLLWPLLAVGAASVLWWRATDDLRFYALVQFFPPLAILVTVAMDPGRYRKASLFAAMAFYTLAKLLEWQDARIGEYIATGGHPWKHLAAAAAVMCLARGVTVSTRERECA
jgi:hypothetical protein